MMLVQRPRHVASEIFWPPSLCGDGAVGTILSEFSVWAVPFDPALPVEGAPVAAIGSGDPPAEKGSRDVEGATMEGPSKRNPTWLGLGLESEDDLAPRDEANAG